MTPFLSPPKFEDRNFVKNPPEDGTVARATVVVERGPSELLNHMVPHVQGGLGAGEVDKPSMMIECDLVGVFFVNIFFVFPCKMTGKILPMITITSMILFLFCYCAYIYVYVYTRCLQIKVLVLVGSVFTPVDIGKHPIKNSYYVFFQGPNLLLEGLGPTGKDHIFRTPASRHGLELMLCFFGHEMVHGNKTTPTTSDNFQRFLVKAFIPCLPFYLFGQHSNSKIH